jgi:hypothetical protein
VNSALQEAQDIFGVDFDYEEFDKYDEYGEESEDDEEDEYVDEEGGGEDRRRKEKKARGKKPSRKSIFEIYEPDELKRGHFTDMDNQVKKIRLTIEIFRHAILKNSENCIFAVPCIKHSLLNDLYHHVHCLKQSLVNAFARRALMRTVT